MHILITAYLFFLFSFIHLSHCCLLNIFLPFNFLILNDLMSHVTVTFTLKALSVMTQKPDHILQSCLMMHNIM